MIDTFIAEIGTRLLDYDSLMKLLDVSKSQHEELLNKRLVVDLCRKFARFSINGSEIRSQLSVAKNLVLGRGLTTPLECLRYLLPMRTCFQHLFTCFQMIVTPPETSATCERNFGALKRVKKYLQ